ncbi:M23 family metallopeptidase [Agromyces protaetiae]|uniref:M23 family metallopeptidase n=1 Tax=Agromyces protaetiae TaxID=2509455 RepID=A0A4P6FWD9_9MICO|nr:peptidoglycan DD-metalloendopeptidase family protein [Agromyces protaetiae]QAY74978.1 M23 family metallopeptidase [Agromyces protaetiae]
MSRAASVVALTTVFALAPALFASPSSVAAAHPSAASPASGTAGADERWDWPTPTPHRVVDPYRAPATRYSPGHRGVDLAAVPGAAVAAASAGRISFAGLVAGRPVVSIDHGDGVVSAIEPVEASVSVGDLVRAGDPIGVVATGGHCDAGCVHFGVRVDGDYVSPFLFLGGVPRAVLLPLS